MALEDVVDATKVISPDSETPMGGSGGKLEEIFDVNKADDGSAAAVVVSERVVETETVISFDSNNELECGLGDQEKEKIGLTGVSVSEIDGGLSVGASSDGIIASDEKNKDGEGYIAHIEEGNFGNFKQLSGNEDEKGNVIDEKLENQDNSLRVGDIVWGKIKSHPWWPGQIYDKKDASEFAVKHNQDQFLVAFFGDGSCSWCLPSQLLPFVENFEEMSTDSSSKSFLDAVQEAVDEVGRIVELEMTCNCIPEEKREAFARSVVVNDGLKAGGVMPKVDVNRLSIAKYEPTGLVANVRELAKAVSVGNVLELAITRSWLSTFYRFKCGYELAQYHEPVHIEGLEDENDKASDVANDSRGLIEVSNVGPMDEDWDPIAMDTDDKVFYRRKQKSVAELMGETTVVKPESQKRARTDLGMTLKNRKVDISKSSENSEAEKGEVGPVNCVKPKDIEVSDAEMASDKSEEELELSTPRERKKSKYLSPPYTNLTWWMGNSSSKTGKRTMEGTIDLFASQSVSKYADKASEEKTNGQLADENDLKLSFPTSVVDIEVNKLLSEIKHAALDNFYLSKKGSLDMVWEFVSALRSSTYLHGPDYKIYRKCKAEEKRKPMPSELENDIGQKKVKLSEGDELEETALPCLEVSFTPGFPLPSKEDIIEHFGKFGVLVKKETKVIADSNSVKIVYTKDCDAEAAFRSSFTESPFGSENINYKLKPSSAGSSYRISRPNDSSLVKDTLSDDDLISDVSAVNRKLETMTAILENYYSKFSAEEKCSLKDEMKCLMQRVELTCDKVRVIADSSSS